MTYGELNNAVPVMNKLVGQNLHLRQAYQLMKIAKKANEELDFFQTRHKEIILSDKDDDEKIKMMTELLNFEIPWTIEPLTLSINDDLILSAADLEAARGLIEIIE